MENIITFNDLPKAFTNLQETVNNIQSLLIQYSRQQQPEPETLLTVQDAAKFLTLSVPTIYGLISKGEIPVMKRSKRCYFSKADLLNYMKAGRKKTVSEIEAETDSFLSSQKRKAMGGQAK